ncbi:MAG: ferredoxin [Euryarchaeota archaeon]|nr:ferredoxin [Euryarchaeota archaeon]
MAEIIIDYDKCDGADCGECADICPMEILVIEGDKIVVQCQEECSLCEVCMDVCPNMAITVKD